MEEEKKKEEREIKPIAQAIKEAIIRDVGQYGGTYGLDKLFYLTNAIYHLLAHLKYDFVIPHFNNEMQKLKKLEEDTGVRTPYRRIKDWDNMFDILQNARPHIDEIKYEYDKIRKGKTKEDEKTAARKKIAKKFYKKVSPYTLEIYFLFNFLMEISGLQALTIPTQAWQTPDTATLVKMPPIKAKPSSSIDPMEKT